MSKYNEIMANFDEKDIEIAIAVANLQKGNTHPEYILNSVLESLYDENGSPVGLFATVENGGSNVFFRNLTSKLRGIGFYPVAGTNLQIDLFYNSEQFRLIAPPTFKPYKLVGLEFSHGVLQAALEHRTSGIEINVTVVHATSGPKTQIFATKRIKQWADILKLNSKKNGVIVGDFNPASIDEALILKNMADESGYETIPLGKFDANFFEVVKALKNKKMSKIKFAATLANHLVNTLSSHPRDYLILPKGIWSLVPDSLVLTPINTDHPASRKRIVLHREAMTEKIK